MNRLEALGDPPYLEIDEARRRYTDGQSVRVVAAGDPPAWFLMVSPKRHRFTLTFYAATGTPIREAMWEDDGGTLFCRRVIDLFYPEGDPGGRVPYAEAISVTRQISTDGVVGVTMASPLGDDEFRETVLETAGPYRLAIPDFGEWSPLLDSSTPPELERFGIEALDALTSFAEDGVHAGPTHRGQDAPGEGWRVSASVGDIMGAVDAVVAGSSSTSSVPVLDRGAAHVLPLALQAGPDSGRPADEELRRITVLADGVRDACDHRAGHGIAVPLLEADAGDGSYGAALRAAHATEATFWEFDSEHAVVLVWQRQGLENPAFALCIQVIPASWVSPSRDAVALDDGVLNWSSADVIGRRGPADVAG